MRAFRFHRLSVRGLLVLGLCAFTARLFAAGAGEAPSGGGAGFALVDALGREVRFERPASRVVSLSPAVTEIFFALGAGGAVVGRTAYCNYPREALAIPAVGEFSGATISVEAVLALRPDLVVGSALMHATIFALLEQAGLKTFAVEPEDIDGAMEVIAALGRIAGREAGAEAVTAGMQATLAEAAALARGKAPRSVLWVVWDEPLMTAGGPTFVNDALRRAGAINIFGSLREAYPEVSIENILALQPDWIMTSEHNRDVTADGLAARPFWRELEAVKARRVAQVNEDWINRFGPRLARAALQIARILYE